MIVSTWNVNSVRARLEHLVGWLKEARPDVCLLQETKVVDEVFPKEPLEDLGYNIAVFGQKSYNGVAILSKIPFDDVRQGFPGLEGTKHEHEARYIEADIKGETFASVYVPNGRDVNDPMFDLKLLFLDKFKIFLSEKLAQDIPFIIGGDYNVALDESDVYDHEKFKDRVLFSLSEKKAMRRILNEGVFDVIGSLEPRCQGQEKRPFTWWDYRQGSWQNNKGLRIDHFLASPEMMDRIQRAWVDTSPRELPQPSDHAPVCCSIE